jgi:hypothetical protein
MIAGTGCYYPSVPFLLAHEEDLVEGPSDLERASYLQVLELQEKIHLKSL